MRFQRFGEVAAWAEIFVFFFCESRYGCYAVGATIVINASSVDLRYQAVNPPIVFDIAEA